MLVLLKKLLKFNKSKILTNIKISKEKNNNFDHGMLYNMLYPEKDKNNK